MFARMIINIALRITPPHSIPKIENRPWSVVQKRIYFSISLFNFKAFIHLFQSMKIFIPHVTIYAAVHKSAVKLVVALVFDQHLTNATFILPKSFVIFNSSSKIFF